MNLPIKNYLARLLLIAGLFNSTLAIGVDESDLSASDLRVAQFVNSAKDSNVVILNGGRTQGIVDGAVFTTYRSAGSPKEKVWIETGVLKALVVKDNLTVAQVTRADSALAKVFFPKYEGVMAGDSVMENKVSINAVQIATPSTDLSYEDIFEDPKSSPVSYELTDEGKESIRKAASAFSNARLPILMVEGHTDGNGPASANQIESQQRAMVVRQFLVSELKFDPKRVIAIGFGEAEPLVEGFAPGYQQANRRVVLKAVSSDQTNQL